MGTGPSIFRIWPAGDFRPGPDAYRVGELIDMKGEWSGPIPLPKEATDGN